MSIRWNSSRTGIAMTSLSERTGFGGDFLAELTKAVEGGRETVAGEPERRPRHSDVGQAADGVDLLLGAGVGRHRGGAPRGHVERAAVPAGPLHLVRDLLDHRGQRLVA